MDRQKFLKDPIWIPDKNSGSTMKKFMQHVGEKYNLKFNDYWDLHKWSVNNVGELWAEIWNFFGVIYSRKYDKVIDSNASMEDAPKWFEGARLNFAENLLKFKDDSVALLISGEDREVERVTYKQMYEETKLYAAALRTFGLKKGDRVACYMSNRKEPVIAMLAVTSIGAIWTGGLPTMGTQAFLNRIKQVEPRVLFAIDQFPQNKEIIYLLDNVQEIVNGLPSLEKVIIVPSKPESRNRDIRGIRNSCFLEEFLRTGYSPDGSIPEIIFEQVSFSHPVFINYTSGTTGLPKTIVHGFGGLLAGVRDYALHFNSQRGDCWLTISAVGWVSWNFLNHILFVGHTLMLFEGMPYFLTPTYLWDMVDELKLTRMFIAPSVLDDLEAKGYLPAERHHLSSLNMVQVGSSVVKPHNYDFAYKILKKHTTFAVGCGSTEIMSFCLTTDNSLPMYKGEISAPCLGIEVEILDDAGRPLIGELGEFTISKPVPSLPLGLWGDTSGELFKKTYFSKYKGKFTIGDTALINPVTKGIIMCGRSDETLKPKGCRFGSSEIYNVVKHFPEIRDSLCVAQYGKNMDERAVLFIMMQENALFNQNLVERLRKRIAEDLTVSHVPEVILEVPGIPYNANRKKMEIIVKKIINKMPHNPETVYNSECLKYYDDIPELQGY